MARIQIPVEIDNALAMADLPDAGEMSLASSLSYAVFIAGESGRRLVITGDRTAWNNSWGELVEP